MKVPTVLVICDGLGIAPRGPGNAVELAGMPFLKKLMRDYPSTLLEAAGEYVGLLPGFIGNSEVGHLTLGAGRVIKSSIARFHELVQSGGLFTHPAAERFRSFAQGSGTLHLVGLLSDGGVHSHELHLYGLLELAAQCNIKKVVVHPILDGRDVAPQSAETYLERLEHKLKDLGIGRIGSLQGRFYAMDRDKNWERTSLAYQTLCGRGAILKTEGASTEWRRLLAASYKANITDEFVKPMLFTPQDAIKAGDALVMVNVRPDRALQLTTFFTDVEVQRRYKVEERALAFVLTGYRYAPFMHNPVILEPEYTAFTLLDVIEKAQPFRPIFLIAETEKYAHVTYFFKGMRDEHVPQETRIMIPSLKMRDYVHLPEMAATLVTQQTLQVLNATRTPPFCLVNYANPDMVGHSGNLKATIKACQVLDEQLAILYQEIVEKRQGLMIVTADHGNAEGMLDEKGGMQTSHTRNPVPFIIANSQLKGAQIFSTDSSVRGIAHIAPTLLQLMGIARPSVMVDPLF